MPEFLMRAWEETATLLDPRQPRTIVPLLAAGVPLAVIGAALIWPAAAIPLVLIGLAMLGVYGLVRLE